MATSTQPSLVPPFTRESAILKVRKAEDNWNSRNPHQVSLGYTPDSIWRNRAEFIHGREEIVRCAWLAGCDGARSTVRHGIGAEFTGQAEPNEGVEHHQPGELGAGLTQLGSQDREGRGNGERLETLIFGLQAGADLVLVRQRGEGQAE